MGYPSTNGGADSKISRDVVWVRRPTGALLVECIGKGRCVGGYLASKELVLKWQSRSVHLPLDPLRLSVLLLPKGPRSVQQQSLPTLVCRSRKPMVRGQVSCKTYDSCN